MILKTVAQTSLHIAQKKAVINHLYIFHNNYMNTQDKMTIDGMLDYGSLGRLTFNMLLSKNGGSFGGLMTSNQVYNDQNSVKVTLQ